MSRLLLACLLLIASGCHPGPALKSPEPSQAARAPRAVLLYEQHCAGCHESGEEPSLVQEGRLEGHDAIRAALMLAAERMPPDPADLPPVERASFIEALCEVGAPDVDTCRKAMGVHPQGTLVRKPAEMVRSAERMFRPAGERRPGVSRESLLAHVQTDTRIVRLDPTLLALLVLYAIDQCPPEIIQAPDMGLEGCVRQLLSLEFLQVPGPALAAPEGG